MYVCMYACMYGWMDGWMYTYTFYLYYILYIKYLHNIYIAIIVIVTKIITILLYLPPISAPFWQWFPFGFPAFGAVPSPNVPGCSKQLMTLCKNMGFVGIISFWG